MIFASVGTQLPFPRLIDALEALAPDLGEEIMAQTGPLGPEDAARWPHLKLEPSLIPERFEALFTAARVVVAHAGIGTILSAKRFGKPLVILPRRHALGEHRNDHQMATARQLEASEGIYVAWDAAEIGPLLRRSDLAPATDKPAPSLETLITRLRGFIAA